MSSMNFMTLTWKYTIKSGFESPPSASMRCGRCWRSSLATSSTFPAAKFCRTACLSSRVAAALLSSLL